MVSVPRRARVRAAMVAATVGACVAVTTAGCSAGSGQPGASRENSSGGPTALVVGVTAEPASLDFTHENGAAIPQALLTNVYEGLVKVDQDGKIVPGLASAWQVSPDRLTYTFDLVTDAKFTNGSPFTADDVKFSIDRVKNGGWTTSLAAAMNVVRDVNVTSPAQVQVTLSAPSNDWLYRMTTRVGAMFSRTGVDALATTPIGTGPYRFMKWTKGDSIVLERNPDYWGAQPYFDRVTLRYFKEAAALNNSLLSGGIQVISQVTAPDSLGQFSDSSRYQVLEGTTNAEVVLSFNNARAPFTNVSVRQAARAAIDHRALLDRCWGGRGELIGSMVPPTDPWYEDLTGIAPYDPATAKSLLARAGQPNPTIRLRVPTLPYATSCGQVVKSQLEQVGFTVKLDQLEFPAAWLSSVFTQGDYEASIVAHVEPRDLPAVFGNPDYYIHYKNPELTAALAAADSGDEETQVAKMREAARLISEDAASDWLFLMPNLVVADTSITGLPKNAISESFDLTSLGHR